MSVRRSRLGAVIIASVSALILLAGTSGVAVAAAHPSASAQATAGLARTASAPRLSWHALTWRTAVRSVSSSRRAVPDRMMYARRSGAIGIAALPAGTSSASRGTVVRARMFLATSQAGAVVGIRLKEAGHAGIQRYAVRLWGKGWHRMTARFVSRAAHARLVFSVVGWDIRRGNRVRVRVQSLSVSGGSTGGNPAPTPPPPPPPNPKPTSCVMNHMGIPLDGSTFAGAAYNIGNPDLSPLEAKLGARLGVDRIYFQASQVANAVSKARADVAAGRIPWVSFKLPASWSAMAGGAGDSWARDIAQKLGALNGPVWLAFHHEPENDGDIATWKRIQERLAPIVHANSNNIAYTVVLTGWSQLHGPSQYSLSNIWPNTRVDLAGFDVYNWYGQTGRSAPPKFDDLVSTYFRPLSAWARSKGIPWGLGETGASDQAMSVDPTFISKSYAAFHSYGGAAYAYYDSAHDPSISLAITTALKTADFARVAKEAPKPSQCAVR